MKIFEKIKTLFTHDELFRIGVLFLGMLVMSFLEVLGVASIAPFMGVVTNPAVIHDNQYLSFIYQYFDFTNDKAFIMVTGAMVIFVLVISNGFNAFMMWKMTTFSKMHGHMLSMRLLSTYLNQSYSFFLGRNTADLGKNILTEVTRCVDGAIFPALNALSKIIVSIFLIGFLLFLDVTLALVVSIVLGGSYLLTYKLVRRNLDVIGLNSTNAVLNRFKVANEALSGIKDIKLRGNENKFLQYFSIHSENDAKYNAQSLLISTLPRYALETISFSGIILIIIYFISNDTKTEQLIPLLSLYALAGFRLLPAVQQIYGGLSQVKYNLPALLLLIKDLKLYKSESEYTDTSPGSLAFEDKIELKSIDYSYPNTDVKILNKFNLTVACNTTVGLVGTTGSGKTTVVDIILGLLDPDSGGVLIDDVEITPETLPQWRIRLGYVPQSVYLIDDTIESNIAFGLLEGELDFAKVQEAAKLAELDDFIMSLPMQYKTMVGERGVRLSGGQLQRIGIARALYYNPTVLIMDEATSSLDGNTEDVIMEAVHNLRHKITIIMIAYRLSTLKECDVIHILKNGVIHESGNYEALFKSNDEFRKLADK